MAIKLGYISGVHGIKGWVKVFSFCEPRKNIFSYSNWLINDSIIKLENSKINGKKLLAKLENINSIENTEPLVNCDILIEQLPKLTVNEFYWYELIGLEVVNTNGVGLGIITQMLATGANDVMIVKNNNHQTLIPFTLGTHVVKVSLKDKNVVVDWQEENSS